MRTLIITTLLVILAGCKNIQPDPLEQSSGHISTKPITEKSAIPELVQQVPVLPEPEAIKEPEKYTVVVNEVPVKELLFALARDAQINVDIDPDISGVVTINGVDQTLPQLLDRIARQVDLRYEFTNDNLIILPDEPFVRTYNVGYLNLSRETSGSVTVSTQIASTSSGGEGSAGGGGGGNTSTTAISSESNHQFWENLVASLSVILGNDEASATDDSAIVINPVGGLVTVRATANQHKEIQGFIERVLESVKRQVLIQATVVEVTLSDQFQAGINWSIIDWTKSGLAVGSNILGASGFVFDEIGNVGLTNPTLAGPPVTTSTSLVEYQARGNDTRVDVVLSLLSEFGDTKVLSSPQIMVLNNHTAVLKVVENFVYFEVEQEIESGNALAGTGPLLATTTTARTIPVGLVMTVTPQISNDSSVTINVRPTISSVVRTEIDPNPALVAVQNRIPVVRVREMESILKVDSNQIAVLGGLMQDTFRGQDKKTPGISQLPLFGNLFKARNQESLKTELVIFLRPVVVKNASIDGDFKDFRHFLDVPESEAKDAGSQGE